MIIESAYATIYGFLVTHQLVALGVLVALALLLWRKPAAFFQLVILVLCLTVALYIGSSLGGAGGGGVKNKNKMINETESKIFN